MPLGQRSGDKSDSRICGVDAELDDDMPHVPNHNLAGGFDFVLAPLVFTFTHPEIADKQPRVQEVALRINLQTQDLSWCMGLLATLMRSYIKMFILVLNHLQQHQICFAGFQFSSRCRDLYVYLQGHQ